MLSLNQRQFVEAYLQFLNIKKAADYVGISYSTARQWLYLEEIQEEISNKAEQLSRRNIMNVQRLITELSAVAGSNILDYFDASGKKLTLKDIKSMPEPVQKCIQQLDETILPDGTVKIRIKLYDKLAALQQLCKVFGLELERVLLTINDNSDTVSGSEITPSLPAPSSISDWEMQVKEARRARESVPIGNAVVAEIIDAKSNSES
mgnify:CR=1 FL=1